MNDFEVMSEMSKKNLDIRMSPSLVATQQVKAGGHITMGIDGKTLMDVTLNPEKYYVALYVVNKEQFDSIRDGKENKPNSGELPQG